jgi:hypothetical protein
MVIEKPEPHAEGDATGCPYWVSPTPNRDEVGYLGGEGHPEIAKIAGIPPQQAKPRLAGDPGCQRVTKLVMGFARLRSFTPGFHHPVKPNPGSPGAPICRRSFRMTNRVAAI